MRCNETSYKDTAKAGMRSLGFVVVVVMFCWIFFFKLRLVITVTSQNFEKEIFGLSNSTYKINLQQKNHLED